MQLCKDHAQGSQVSLIPPSLQLYKLEITTAASEGKLEIDPRLTGLPGLRSLVLKIIYVHIQHFISKWLGVTLYISRESGSGKHILQGTESQKTALVLPDM